MKKMQNNKATTFLLTLSASSPRFCDFKSGVFVNFPLSRKDHRFNLSLGKKQSLLLTSAYIYAILFVVSISSRKDEYHERFLFDSFRYRSFGL